MSVRLKKGSTVLGYVGIGANHYKTWHGMGSGTILAKVMKGEHVTVETYYKRGPTYCLFGGAGHGYNYFSAFPVQFIS